MPADLPRGRGDERRLTQVLMNLVSNAIKFTEAGAVSIRAKVEDGSFVVAVTDTGVGIAAEDASASSRSSSRSTARARARRAAPAWASRSPGASSSCTAAGSGSNSTPGQGSTFAFTLPLRSSSRDSGMSQRILAGRGLAPRMTEGSCATIQAPIHSVPYH